MGIYWDLLGYMLGSIDFQNLRWFWWTFHWGISQMSSFVRKAQIPHKPHNNFAQHKLILTYGNIMEYIDMHKLFLGFAGLLACWLPSSNQARQWNISHGRFSHENLRLQRISPCHNWSPEDIPMSLSIYPHFMVGRMPSNQVVPFLLAIFVISAPKSRQSTYLYLSLWNPRGSANQAFLRQWQLQLHCCNWSCEAGAAQGRTYMYTWYVHTLYNVVYQLFYLLYCKLYILTLYVN